MKGVVDLMASRKSIWSTVLSIAGIVLLISSYSIADDPTDPTSYEKMIIKLFFFSFIFSMIASIYMGILAIRANEKGILKYSPFFVVIIFIFCIALQPILMAFFGFGG